MDEQVKPFVAGQVIDFIDDQLRGSGFVIQQQGSAC
jgi:hypothetical protein